MKWVRFPAQHAVAAFIAVFIFGPIFWLAFDREPPYIITNGHIDPEVVIPDEQYTVRWDVKVVRACPGNENSRVISHIIDKNGEQHVYAPVRGQFSGTTEITRVKIMLDVPSGPAKYYSEVCYPCNPVQEWWPVCFNTPIISFSVGPPRLFLK